MSYRQLSKEERIKLESYLEAGLTQGACALRLGRSPGTISRELQRNGPWVYDGKRAQASTKKRRRKPPMKLEEDAILQTYVVDALLKGWSPEQIAGRLALEQGQRVMHHDTIYWWIYLKRRDLIVWLRRGKKRQWRRKHGTRMREKQRELKKKRWIHERPAVIEKRKRVGDWEGDTVWGKEKTERIATFVDRKSGYLLARRTTATAQDTRIATKILFRTIPKSKKISCTLDNGTEFSGHERMEKDTGLTIYFAHPYSSWERGTNENTNGLLREFFPKGTAFASVDNSHVSRAVRILNHRPRKRHHYRTPYEMFKCCT